MMRSLTKSSPVVSKSKTTSGRVRFSFIYTVTELVCQWRRGRAAKASCTPPTHHMATRYWHQLSLSIMGMMSISTSSFSG